MARLMTALSLACILLTGCATQKRPSQVGEVGYNPRGERALQAEMEAQDYYDYNTPKAGATIRSNPAGALVEWYNPDGIWVSVGTTPTLEIVIEATGKPELFRVSAPGYMPQIRWVATTPNSEGVVVSFELDRELDYDRYYIGD
jgi:histidinol-phosphate/aromatic aminotransferase/cobyric acid decarboxylase-like protein